MSGRRLLAFAFSLLVAAVVAFSPQGSAAAPAASPSPVSSLEARATAAAFAAAIQKSESDRLSSSVARATIVSTAVKGVVVDIAAAVAALFGLILLILARDRIVEAAKNGALTLGLPPFASISIPARVAATQQQTQPVPPPPGAAPSAHPVGAKGAGYVAKSNAIRDDAVTAYYHAFASALFVSQFLVLQHAQSETHFTFDGAKAIYNASTIRAVKLSVDDWLGYLAGYGMISVAGAASVITLTQRGSDFLAWANSEGYGVERIAAEGRGY